MVPGSGEPAGEDISGGDHDGAWLAVAATIATFVLIDRGSWLLTRQVSAEAGWLALDAVADRPVLALGSIAAAGLIAARFGLVTVRWQDLEHGLVLRYFAFPILLLTVLHYALYGYNWFAGSWHVWDRLAVVALAIAVWFRPFALLALVGAARVVVGHFDDPMGNPAGGPTGLSLSVLIGLAAALLVCELVDGRRTRVVPVVMAAVVSSSFFTSGLAKLSIRWWSNDLDRLPINGYEQGWLGHTDGDLALGLAEAISMLGPLALVLTLLVELGFGVAVLRSRWFVVFAATAPLFHGLVLVAYGFVFLDWVIVELALVWLLVVGLDRQWLARSWQPRLAVAGFLIGVVPSYLTLGALHLAWFDVPVGYRYEFVAVLEDGSSQRVAPLAFGQLSAHATWGNLNLGPATPVTGPYGITTDRDRKREIDSLESFADLGRLEADQGEISAQRRADSVRLLSRFVSASHEPRGHGPPVSLPVFLASVTGAAYGGEPIDRLEVTQVTWLDLGDRVEYRRSLAAVIDEAGESPLQ